MPLIRFCHDDEPFEVVSDFGASSPGRGCLDPPRDPWSGEVIQPRSAPPLARGEMSGRMQEVCPLPAGASRRGRCATPECGRVVESRGLCWSCYGRARRQEAREVAAALARIRDRWGAEAAEHVREEIDRRRRLRTYVIGDGAALAHEAEQALQREGASTVRRTE